MTINETPSICLITDADYDLTLRQDISNIETLIQPSDSWSEQTITKLLSQDINDCLAVINPKTIINEVGKDTQIIAYCLFSKVFEVAEILRIGTHPNFQRRGYAERLLKMLIKHMPNKGLDRILLEVRADNIGAIKLYRKMEFEVIHTRKDYYLFANENGINQRFDALVMEYVLK